MRTSHVAAFFALGVCVFGTSPTLGRDFETWLKAGNDPSVLASIESAILNGTDRISMRMVGHILMIKTSPLHNSQKGIRFLLRSADLGDADAQFSIGHYYDSGEYLTKNPLLAEKYYRLSAAQNKIESMYNLAALLVDKKEPQYNSEIMKLLISSALIGSVRSMTTLGIFYFRGVIAPADYVESYRWLNLASSRGDAEAQGMRNAIAGRMTPSQIAEAQKRSSETKISDPAK